MASDLLPVVVVLHYLLVFTQSVAIVKAGADDNMTIVWCFSPSLLKVWSLLFAAVSTSAALAG